MAEIKSQWKTAEDIERLTISKTKIGGGSFGTVYLGRLKFKGKKPLRVAVKVFHKEPHWLYFRHYDRAVDKLVKAGVKMPKTGILYHDGKYIQVSGVFGNTSRETKILPWESAIDKNNLEKLFEHMARIFNAGYTPSNDSIGFVKNKRGGEFIVHDFDYFARVEYQDTEEKKKDMMKLNLKYLLNQLQVNSGIKKQEAVQRLLEKVQHPEMQQLLKELQTEQL